MAQPPRFKKLTREDYSGAPDWVEPLFLVLNESLSGLVLCLDHALTRTENFVAGERLGLEFTCKALALDTFPIRVRNTLASRPKHVSLTSLERKDGGRIEAPFSMTWRGNSAGEIELSFQGLTGGAGYKVSIAYE